MGFFHMDALSVCRGFILVDDLLDSTVNVIRTVIYGISSFSE